MKRREFLQATAGLGFLAPGAALAGIRPCPPPQISVSGGTTAASACNSTGSGALPALRLLSDAPPGLKPWTTGHAFRRGDVPALVTGEGESIQCDVRNRWSDGSVKFAVLSGISNISAVKQLKLIRGGGSVGAVLPESRITAILGDKDFVVTLGAYGKVSLKSLVGRSSTGNHLSPGRVRMAVSGPIMSEFHYMGIPSGGDAHLRVWFYVRVYSDSSIEVETIVENGWFQVPSPAQRQYVAMLRILDRDLQVNNGNAIRHFHHTRWSRVDWLGADPMVTAAHDGTYLRSTRLVPNYAYGPPSEMAFQKSSTVSAAIDATYEDASRPAPFELGDLRTGMGTAGEGVSDQIGLLPFWEALAITSGDKRAINASIFNARNLGRYPVFLRDETTLEPPSRVATGYESLWTGNSSIPWPAESAPVYARSHHPSWGYFPYLITGRWQFWEACASLASYNHFQTMTSEPWPIQKSNGRGGAKGIVTQVGSSARMLAWGLRTLAQAACFTPDGNRMQVDFREQWATNVDHYWGLQSGKYASYEYGRRLENNLGIVMTAGNPKGHPPLDGYLVSSPWMHHYVASAIGFSWDLEINRDASSALNHQRLRDHAYKSVIGMCGTGRTSDDKPFGYSWRRLPNNYMAFGEADENGLYVNDSPPPLKFWNSWSEVYEKMLVIGGAKHQPDVASDLPFIAVLPIPPPFGFTDESGYLNTVISAHLKHPLAVLAYAVDHNVQGAEAALARIRSSSSWRLTHAEAKDFPVAGVEPRTQ